MLRLQHLNNPPKKKLLYAGRYNKKNPYIDSAPPRCVISVSLCITSLTLQRSWLARMGVFMGHVRETMSFVSWNSLPWRLVNGNVKWVCELASVSFRWHKVHDKDGLSHAFFFSMIYPALIYECKNISMLDMLSLQELLFKIGRLGWDT